MSIFARTFRKIFIYLLRSNEFESTRLREYFAKSFGIRVGLYSYGCFDPKRIPRNTTVGRYCSFAPSAQIFNGNHGLGFLSMHPYLYNTAFGIVESETIKRTACTIEDDAWLGHNSIILPSVSSIGRGAVVAAGAVVTKNVPPYAIVAGNPAKIIKFRFSPEVIAYIESTKWWLLSKAELAQLASQDQDLAYRPAKKIMEVN